MTNNLSSFPEAPKGDSFPFRKIFETLPGLFLILSPELIIQAASDAYLRETKTVREKIVGKPLFYVFPANPETASSKGAMNLAASLQQVLSSRSTDKMDILQYDISDPAKPGQYLERFWSTINIPVLNEQGEVLYIIHETSNVTEKVIARRQLKETQSREQSALAMAEHQRARLERLFNQAPAAMAMLDGPEMVFKVINPSYQQLFPGRELSGRPLFEALPELLNQAVAEIIRNVYLTGETFEGREMLIPVARYKNQPPEDIYWNFIYQALYNEQGKVDGILIFALDVSEMVKARQQLEKSAEILKGLNQELSNANKELSAANEEAQASNEKLKVANEALKASNDKLIQTQQALQQLNQELEQRVESRTTELEIARAEAEQQKERLYSLLMQAPVGIGIFDGPEYIVDLVNSASSKIVGRTPQQLLHKPLFEALPEVKGQGFEEILSEVFHNGKPFEMNEVPATIERNGKLEEGYYHTVYQPLRNSRQEITGIIQIVYEVTEQVRARRQLELVLDSMPQITWITNPQGETIHVNKVWFDYTGAGKEEMANEQLVSYLHPEDSKAQLEGWEQSISTGKRFELEIRIKRAVDNTYRWHLNRAVPVRNASGDVTHWIGTATDIHEQKLAEQSLHKLSQELAAANEELTAANEGIQTSNRILEKTNQQLTRTNVDLDNFIYTASHDLKAPILNIEGLIQVLLRKLPEEMHNQEQIQQVISMIQSSVERFRKTISSLTDITKLQKEENKEVTSINISETVQEVILDLEQLIQENSVRLELDVKACPVISYSEKNLRSIIYNLLSNAIKYQSPERSPMVRLQCTHEGDYIILTVQDNGLGIDLAHEKKLFSMFHRFHKHVEGSGIGLYMVKRIVENAGGKIKVESEVGKGSTFKVYLAIKEPSFRENQVNEQV